MRHVSEANVLAISFDRPIASPRLPGTFRHQPVITPRVSGSHWLATVWFCGSGEGGYRATCLCGFTGSYGQYQPNPERVSVMQVAHDAALGLRQETLPRNT